MSSVEQLRQAAEGSKRQKNWAEACDKYSDLLKAEFREDDEHVSVQVCKDLIEYAYCMLQEEKPDLEAAWECLEHAKRGYMAMPPAEVPPTSLADIYDFLGEIGMKNGAYEEAALQYNKIIELTADHPEMSWRIGLSAFYTKTLCLEGAGKLPEAIEAAGQAIAFADAQKQKEQNAEDVSIIEDFKGSIIAKRDAIVAKNTP